MKKCHIETRRRGRNIWNVLKCDAAEGWKEISWTDHVRNEEVLLRVNEQRNILPEIDRWKANWIGLA
jgi:hypothetical protein